MIEHCTTDHDHERNPQDCRWHSAPADAYDRAQIRQEQTWVNNESRRKEPEAEVFPADDEQPEDDEPDEEEGLPGRRLT